jgi:hypothetical protein
LKVKQINLLKPIEFTPPLKVSANDIEVVEENELIINETSGSVEEDNDDKGQISLF